MANVKRVADESEDSSLRMATGVSRHGTGPSGRRAEGLVPPQSPFS